MFDSELGTILIDLFLEMSNFVFLAIIICLQNEVYSNF